MASPDSNPEVVEVPVAQLRELQETLTSLVHDIDILVRERPMLLRLIRVVNALDPDKTPVHPSASMDAEKAFQTSESHENADSIRRGPRFWPPSDS